MALIEVFHVVASELLIDTTSTTDIPQGKLVGYDTNDNTGLLVLANSTTVTPIGIAGDSRSAGTTSYTPESGSALDRAVGTTAATSAGSLVMGAWGDAARFTQNRVADNYNETLASGKMTVYHSGGEFWTDMYETENYNANTAVTSYVPGRVLYTSLASSGAGIAGDVEDDNGGRFTTENGSGFIVAVCLQGPLNYPNGVPGTTAAESGHSSFTALPEGGNSMTWGSFIKLKLTI